MRDRKLVGMDEQKIIEESQRRAEKLLTKLPYTLEPRWPVL